MSITNTLRALASVLFLSKFRTEVVWLKFDQAGPQNLPPGSMGVVRSELGTQKVSLK